MDIHVQHSSDSQNVEVNGASAAGSYYTQLLAIINRLKYIISNHFLTDNSSHHMIRKQVHKQNLDAAEKMKNKFNNAKRLKLKILNAVTVKVPNKDRSPCNQQQVSGVLVKICNDTHKIRTKCGISKFQYQTDELESHTVKVVSVDGWENDMVILLREALWKFNHRQDDVSLCKCKFGCNNKKCRCYKDNLMCTSHFHNGTSCHNKGLHISIIIIKPNLLSV